MSQDISRRNFLRTGSAGAAAVGLGGLAGCTSSIPFVGDSSSGPSLEDWLVTASFSDVVDSEPLDEEYNDAQIDDDELQNRGFEYVIPESILDNEDETDSRRSLSLGSDFRSRAGAPAIETEWVLRQTLAWEVDVSYTEETWGGGEESAEGSFTNEVPIETLAGSFDTESVTDALEVWVDDNFSDDDSLSGAGTESGFDLYEIEDWAFAVSEDYLIQVDATPEDSYDDTEAEYVDAVAVLEAAISARADGENLWIDDDDGEELISLTESGDEVSGSLTTPLTADAQYDDPSAEMEEEYEDSLDDWEYGLTGISTTKEIDGDTTEYTQVFLYDDEEYADSEALNEHVDRNRDYGETYDSLEDYSIEEDGRALILTGSMSSRAAF